VRLLCRWLAKGPADWICAFRSLTRPVWYSLFRLRVTLADMILVQPRRLSVKVQRRFSVLPRLIGQALVGACRRSPAVGHAPLSVSRIALRGAPRDGHWMCRPARSSGVKTLDKFAGDLRATHPYLAYTPHGELQALLHNAGRLAWGSGPRSEAPDYTGFGCDHRSRWQDRGALRVPRFHAFTAATALSLISELIPTRARRRWWLARTGSVRRRVAGSCEVWAGLPQEGVTSGMRPVLGHDYEGHRGIAGEADGDRADDTVRDERRAADQDDHGCVRVPCA